MEINLEQLREAAKLFSEIATAAEKIQPVLQSIEKNKGVVVPVMTDRFIERGDVCKILKIGSASLQTLIERGQLTPYYIADSSSMKFKLSEVTTLPVSKRKSK